ncbi:MAG TPA: phosphotransacetylase family protein [Clostridia bacterium]|nr:phosphotransacetylase family protein [Clostridia bacterium]
MNGIFVVGRYGSGKTAICLGLSLKLKERGLKVGYFKPIGVADPLTCRFDDDVLLMRSVLGMAETHDDLTCYCIGPQYLSRYDMSEDHTKEVKARLKEMSSEYDVLIIEGTTYPYVMASLGLDAISLSRDLGLPVLFVAQPASDYSVDRVILYDRYMSLSGIRVLGNIFNNVPRPLLDKVVGVYKPIIEKHGFKVLGIIPKSLEISLPTVREYYAILGGELLSGEDHMDRLVEDIVVGAMTQESAIQYLRRSRNKAVVTGGDRADLALAALETDTSVIILTGGLYPNVQVLARAQEKKVPVILVHYDTYTTVEKLHTVTRKIKPEDKAGIDQAKRNLEEHCDLEALLEGVTGLGSKP